LRGEGGGTGALGVESAAVGGVGSLPEEGKVGGRGEELAFRLGRLLSGLGDCYTGRGKGGGVFLKEKGRNPSLSRFGREHVVLGGSRTVIRRSNRGGGGGGGKKKGGEGWLGSEKFRAGGGPGESKKTLFQERVEGPGFAG